MALYKDESPLFEWDDDKEQINIQKHGIDFDLASKVFKDPYRLEIYDELHSDESEERYITIGFVDRVLQVVYTERREVMRIISSRIATNHERKMYYDRKAKIR